MEIGMRATMRTLLRMLLLVTMLAGVGAAVSMSTASAASNTPPVPTSSVSVSGDTATYCVANYAANSTVAVVNQANGATGTIHTDGTGAGCTTVHLTVSCTQVQHETIVATGTDQASSPATSQAIADVPAGGTGCTTTTPTPTSTDACAGAGNNTATLSIYLVPQGAVVRGSACGFAPGETVDLFVFSTPHFIGSTTAEADGSATKATTIPKCLEPGQHTFELTGETSNHTATAQFTVKASSACDASTGGGGGGVAGVGAGGGGLGGGTTVNNQGGGPTGGLAFTGADIAAMVIAALVLLALGIVTVASVRRRRTAPAA
jgi:hypothetical protein